MINPELMKLLERSDILSVLTDSVVYQLQKIENVKISERSRSFINSGFIII